MSVFRRFIFLLLVLSLLGAGIALSEQALQLRFTMQPLAVALPEGEVVFSLGQLIGCKAYITGPITQDDTYFESEMAVRVGEVWRVIKSTSGFTNLMGDQEERLADITDAYVLEGSALRYRLSLKDSAGKLLIEDEKTVPLQPFSGLPLDCDISFASGEYPLPTDRAITGEDLSITVQAKHTFGEVTSSGSWQILGEDGSQISGPLNDYDGGNMGATVTPDRPGELRVQALIRDARGESPPFSRSIPVLPGMQCQITLDQQEVYAFEPITAHYTLSGGTPPYEVAWGLNNWYSQAPEADQSMTTTLKAPGECYFSVHVTDSAGVSTLFNSLSFTVLPDRQPPIQPHFEVPSSHDVSAPLVVSLSVTGGQGPYTIDRGFVITEANGNRFQIKAEGDEGPLSPGETRRYQASFQVGAQAYLGVQIEDAQGRTLEANSPAIRLTGGHVAEPFIVTPQLSPMPPVLNQPITASWTVSGGTPPYTTIGWYWVINTTDSVYFPMKLTPGQLVLETVFNFDQSMGDAQTGQFSVTMQDAKGRITDSGWLPFIVVQSEPAIPPTLRGDANDSGHLDIGDLTSMLDHMLTQSPLKSPANADTNADSKIDETDLLFIIWGLLP